MKNIGYEINNSLIPVIRRELNKLFSGGQSVFINRSLLLIYLERSTELYLLPKRLENIINTIKIKPFCAGVKIGNVRKKKFYPSLSLIQILAGNAKKRIIITDSAANLFICGRDIFSKSIAKVDESVRKDDIVIILNSRGEALGIAKVLSSSITLKEFGNKVVLQNLLDLGDYIRRREGKDLMKSH